MLPLVTIATPSLTLGQIFSGKRGFPRKVYDKHQRWQLSSCDSTQFSQSSATDRFPDRSLGTSSAALGHPSHQQIQGCQTIDGQSSPFVVVKLDPVRVF